MVLRKVGIVGKHNSWITDLSVPDPMSAKEPEDPNLLLSASRDGLLKLWSVREGASEQKVVCKGHRDVVSGCQLSGDGQFAISCSWDRSMKIWHLEKDPGEVLRSGRIDKQLNTVILSPDVRQILTGGGIRIDLWNTLAEIKYTLGEWCDSDKHSDWVSALEFVPGTSKKDKTEPEEGEAKGQERAESFLSASWDHTLKLWNLNTMKLIKEFVGHKGVVHSISISPDASLIASGGKEAVAKLWDLAEGKHIYDLTVLSTINSLAFSPKRYWLAMATDVSVEVWDLEIKQQIGVDRGPPLPENIPWATCLKWSADGESLFVGHSDGTIMRYIVEDPPAGW